MFDARDAGHRRAQAILGSEESKLITDHVFVELWRLLRRRFSRQTADSTCGRLIGSAMEIEPVGVADLQTALDIGADFPDQDFSLVDRTSFAVMRRLGVSTVATFDHHFAVYRFGPGKRRSFEIAR